MIVQPITEEAIVMLNALLSGLITALSLLLVDLVIPGVEVETFSAALIAALSIAVVNAVIRPFLRLLSLPLTILTFGLFAIVINGFCFWMASTFVEGFTVHGLIGTLLGPAALSFVSTFLSNAFGERFSPLGEGEA